MKIFTETSQKWKTYHEPRQLLLDKLKVHEDEMDKVNFFLCISGHLIIFPR